MPLITGRLLNENRDVISPPEPVERVQPPEDRQQDESGAEEEGEGESQD